MHTQSRHLAAVALITLLCSGGPAFAQSADVAKAYPTRTVRFVNPSTAGGGADIIARILAQQLAKSMGQNFINDSRPGASNIIATEIVAKSPPDGYTLLIAATGTFVTNPLVFAKLPYSDKDFDAGSWYGVMAPAGTPRDIVAKLHGELVKAVKLPEVQQRIVDLGTYPIGNTPEEFSAQIVRERERWAKVVKEAGIKPE